MIRNLLALTGLLAITLAAAMGLQAYGYFDDNGDAPRRVKVSYAGLDLASPEGVQILEQRVNAAINDVCRDYDGRELWSRRGRRECRDEAIAGVTPQIDYAIDRARRGRAQVIATEGYAPPPPPPGYAPPSDQPPLRLVKRTIVTTRTVNTTRPTPPPAVREPPIWHPRPTTIPVRTATYRRLPEAPGSWLPPSAWYQINRAIYRSFQTGRTTHWFAQGRTGDVTVGAKRWVAGCVCRNVRTVKYVDGGQIVVAEGTKCLPSGR